MWLMPIGWISKIFLIFYLYLTGDKFLRDVKCVEYGLDNQFLEFLGDDNEPLHKRPTNVSLTRMVLPGQQVNLPCVFRLKTLSTPSTRGKTLLETGLYEFTSGTCEWKKGSLGISSGNNTLSPNVFPRPVLDPQKREQSCGFRILATILDNSIFECKVNLALRTITESSRIAANELRITPENYVFKGPPINLIVLSEPGPPKLHMSPNDAWIDGDRLNVTCMSEYGNPAPKIRIFSNNREIDKNDSQTLVIYKQPDITNGSSYVTLLRNISLADDGSIFACSVKNDAIDHELWENSTQTIQVQFPPRIFLNPSRLSVEVGYGIHISCLTVAKPKAYQLTWSITTQSLGNDTLINEGKQNTDYKMLKESKKMTDVVVSQGQGRKPSETELNWARQQFPNLENIENLIRVLDLEIPTLTINDSMKVLTCTATNGLQNTQMLYKSLYEDSPNNVKSLADQSSSIPIDVLYGPTVISVPEYSVKEGSNVSIPCTIYANPKPFKVTWRKNERLISINYLSRDPILTIPSIKRSMEGSYVCRAENLLKLSSKPNDDQFSFASISSIDNINNNNMGASNNRFDGRKSLKVGESFTRIKVLYPPERVVIELPNTNPPTKSVPVKQYIRPLKTKTTNLQAQKLSTSTQTPKMNPTKVLIVQENEPFSLSCNIMPKNIFTSVTSMTPKPDHNHENNHNFSSTTFASVQNTGGNNNEMFVGNPKPHYTWIGYHFTDSKARLQTPDQLFQTLLITNTQSDGNEQENYNYNNVQLPKGQELQLAKGPNPIYQVKQANVQDTGIYYCFAHNEVGSTPRASLAVYVKVAPKFESSTLDTVPPSSLNNAPFVTEFKKPNTYPIRNGNELTVKEFTPSFRLECTFTARPEPRIIWLKNGKILETHGSNNKRDLKSNSEYSTFLNDNIIPKYGGFTSVTKSPSAIYSYKLENINNLNTFESNLGFSHFDHAPGLHFPQISQSDSLQNDGIFTSNTERNSHTFHTNQTSNMVGLQNVFQTTSYLYWTNPIRAEDSGLYTCLALDQTMYDDEIFSDTDLKTFEKNHLVSYNVSLRVIHQPYIIKALSPQLIPTVENKDYDAALFCTVQADPKPSFEWEFENQPISIGQNSKYQIFTHPASISAENQYLNYLFNGKRSFYQSILFVKKQDANNKNMFTEEHTDIFGNYTCTVKNELGSLQYSINVQKPTIPEPPTFLGAKNITAENAVIFVRPNFAREIKQTLVLNYYKVETQRINEAIDTLFSNEQQQQPSMIITSNPLIKTSISSPFHQMHAELAQKDVLFTGKYVIIPFDLSVIGLSPVDMHQLIIKSLKTGNSTYRNSVYNSDNSDSLNMPMHFNKFGTSPTSYDPDLDWNRVQHLELIQSDTLAQYTENAYNNMISSLQQSDNYANNYNINQVNFDVTQLLAEAISPQTFSVPDLEANSKYIFWVTSYNSIGSSTDQNLSIPLKPLVPEFMILSTPHIPFAKHNIYYQSLVYWAHNDTLHLTFSNRIPYQDLCINLVSIDQCITIGSKNVLQTSNLFEVYIPNLQQYGPLERNSLNTNDIDSNNNGLIHKDIYVKLCAVYDPRNTCENEQKAEIRAEGLTLQTHIQPQSIYRKLWLIIGTPLIMIIMLLGTLAIVCLKRKKERLLKEYEMKQANTASAMFKPTNYTIGSLKSNNMNNNSIGRKPNHTHNNNGVHHVANGSANKDHKFSNGSIGSAHNKNYNTNTISSNGHSGAFVNRALDLVDEYQVTSPTNNTAYNNINNVLHVDQSHHPVVRNSKFAHQKFKSPEDLLMAANDFEDDSDQEFNASPSNGGNHSSILNSTSYAQHNYNSNNNSYNKPSYSNNINHHNDINHYTNPNFINELSSAHPDEPFRDNIQKNGSTTSSLTNLQEVIV